MESTTIHATPPITSASAAGADPDVGDGERYRGKDDCAGEHESARRSPRAQPRQRRRTEDRSDPYAAEQQSVSAGAEMQRRVRDQGQ